MKIKKDSIKRKTLGFPATWECKTVEDVDVLISYRYGRINLLVDDKIEETFNGPEGEFDVGGSCEDEELLKVLIDESVLIIDNKNIEEKED